MSTKFRTIQIMKKRIYILTFVFLSGCMTNNLFSQNYKSIFGNTSTVWNVILQGFCDAIASNTVTATIDTTIDSNSYIVISGLGGFLREDTVQGKVWFYDLSLNKEYLVMDLSLALGDTSYIYTYNNDSLPITVDSVYFIGGLKHIRFNETLNMCGYSEKIKFIEGSGPNISFNYQGTWNGLPPISYMLCHFKDGIKVTGNYLFNDTCFVYEVGIPENNSDMNSIKIFPNPASDFVHLDIEDFDNKTANVSIYNILGLLVKKQELTNHQKAIDVGDLNDDFYLVIIKIENSIFNQILIIQKK